jgi:hypothetical protein
MKDDECGRSKYKGENMSEWNGIFRFEGEDKGERVWIVLVACFERRKRLLNQTSTRETSKDT